MSSSRPKSKLKSVRSSRPKSRPKSVRSSRPKSITKSIRSLRQSSTSKANNQTQTQTEMDETDLYDRMNKTGTTIFKYFVGIILLVASM